MSATDFFGADVTEETPTIPPPPAQPSEAKERPAHRRSVFFDHEARIRELVEAGYSYRQILRLLRLRAHRSVLARWCQRQGLASRATSSSNPAARAAAAKKSAPLAGPAKSSAPVGSISAALGPEPMDEWAAFRKPSAED